MLASLLLLLAVHLSCWAQPSSATWGLRTNSPRADIDRAVAILAKLPSLRPSHLDAMLTQVGFEPKSRPADWPAFSEQQKLRHAYRWAAAVSPENGDAFIAQMVRRIEERFESLAFDPVFRAYFTSTHAATAQPVEFRRPTASQLAEPLPPRISVVLDRLGRYVQGPGMLGRASVARRNFGLAGDQFDEALDERDSRKFLDGAARRAVPPPPLYQRINGLIEDVLLAAESASHDTELLKVAAELRKMFGDPPAHAARYAGEVIDKDGTLRPDDGRGPDPTSSSGPGPGAGGSPERASRAAKFHLRLEEGIYSSAKSRRYAAVRGRAGGLGGVIAGAAVASDLAAPTEVRVELPAGAVCGIPGKAPPLGRLSVRSGTVIYVMDGIECDVLVAARRLAFGTAGPQGGSPGDAMGLASIDVVGLAETFPLYLSPDGDLRTLGIRRRMVLHPALVDLDVGRALAYLDLWPSAKPLVLRATGEHKDVVKWLLGMRGASTWKWSDSPSFISAAGTSLTVTPILRPAMLSLRTFTGAELHLDQLACDPLQGNPKLCTTLQSEGKAGTDAEGFDAAAPVFIERVRDAAKAEQFLRVLAVFRWAREAGLGDVSGEVPLERSRAKTPDHVIVGMLGDYIAGSADEASWAEQCADFRAAWQESRKRLATAPDGSDEKDLLELLADWAIDVLEEEELLTSDAGGGRTAKCSNG